MLASIGDYIIKGVKGEFYPYKPDIFEKTYDIVDESGPIVKVRSALVIQPGQSLLRPAGIADAHGIAGLILYRASAHFAFEDGH